MQPVNKKPHLLFVFFSLLYAWLASPVWAQQNPLPEAAGVANLTVTVTVDKTVDDKLVAHYRKLAQDLVRNLPAEITRPEDLMVLTANPVYQNMQVVAYFPVINGKADTQAVIKNYRLRFVHADAQQPDPSPPVVVARQGYLSVTPAMGVSIRLQKPGTEEPKPEPLKPVEEPTIKEEVVKKSPPPAPVKVLLKPKPLVINFVADSTRLTTGERQQISELAANLRQRNDIRGYAAIVATYPGPMGDQMQLGDVRLQQIIALLRQLDVDVSRSSVTEIHIQTKRRQFVRLEVELKK